jgi:hypothetical protein
MRHLARLNNEALTNNKKSSRAFGAVSGKRLRDKTSVNEVALNG